MMSVLNTLPQWSPFTVVLIPFIGAMLIGLAAKSFAVQQTISYVTSLVFFIAVLGQLGPLLAGEDSHQLLWEILPGLNIALSIEPLGMIFALLASTLWIVATPYALGYMIHGGYGHLARFFACYAIALGSAAGIAFSDNLLTMFVFYEILSVSTYPLVAHTGTAKARQGARTYLGILLLTSICFWLPAMIWTYAATGTLDFAAGGILQGHLSPTMAGVVLLLFMFGTGKAALMPFHRWLPAAMVAPTPVSALLHAVAVVKAGVFVVLKLALYVFGLDFLREIPLTDVVLYVAAFTMLSASLVAMHQDNLKARLAYSTVSQLSYIVVGAMLASPLAAIGGGMHMVMHGFGKITLFFCAGAIYLASHKTLVSELDGLGRKMPFTMTAFLLGALCVIGIPPMGGLWSKWHLVLGAFDSGHGLILVAFLISTLLNIAYLLPPVLRAFLKPLPEGETATIHEAPLLCVVPLTLTALGAVLLFVLAGWPQQLMSLIFA
jgi:multicomponent Na+:H+ antiporter subunit D